MFRRAQVEDVPKLQAILTEAWQVTYKNLYTSGYINHVIQAFYNQERLINEVTEISQAWSGYYVLEEDGQLVGCIGGGIEESEIGAIYVLYLDPKKKNKGYGSILLAEFTSWQKKMYQIKKQKVSVTEKNEMGLPFYQKHGFKQIGKKKVSFETIDEKYDSLQMIRAV
ncbi:GNAT family N-acetyltransferase [Enterococcus sp. LJL98]